MHCQHFNLLGGAWTGIATGEGTGATMSDDDDQVESDTNLFNGSLDGQKNVGFGPYVPTASMRSLMETRGKS